MDFLDAVVLNGLKQTSISSLSAMFREIAEHDEASVPILTVRLELIQDEVTFRPPLDGTTSSESVKEVVNRWIHGFLKRAEFVEMFGSKVSLTTRVVEQVSLNAINSCTDVRVLFYL